jgi:hypothetical protein
MYAIVSYRLETKEVISLHPWREHQASEFLERGELILRNSQQNFFFFGDQVDYHRLNADITFFFKKKTPF